MGLWSFVNEAFCFTWESDVCQAASNLSDTAGCQGHPKATQSQSLLSSATLGKWALVLAQGSSPSKMDTQEKYDRDYSFSEGHWVSYNQKQIENRCLKVNSPWKHCKFTWLLPQLHDAHIAPSADGLCSFASLQVQFKGTPCFRTRWLRNNPSCGNQDCSVSPPARCAFRSCDL